MCNGNKASPYEHEEILFLSTVAGLVRQNPNLINLFIPAHRCDYLTNANRRSNTVPVKNPLFDYSKVEASIRRISIVVESDVDSESGCSKSVEPIDKTNECSDKNSENCANACDCEEEDRFQLLDTITTYLESAVSIDLNDCENNIIS